MSNDDRLDSCFSGAAYRAGSSKRSGSAVRLEGEDSSLVTLPLPMIDLSGAPNLDIYIAVMHDGLNRPAPRKPS